MRRVRRVGRVRLVRWKALVPLGLIVVLLALGWVLYADRLVERAIEYTGAEIVGARVDVAEADLQLTRGAVVIRGLAAANPDAPMKNLVEAAEIVAAIRLAPLLEKKIVVDTVAIRGVRFGTPREESGALERPSPTSGRIARQVTAWADRIRIPPLNLEGLGTVVNLSGLRPDSLRSLAQAQLIRAAAESLDGEWRGALASLNLQPQLDSARAVTARLQQADLRALGIVGVRNLTESARTLVGELDRSAARIGALSDRFQQGIGEVQAKVQGLTAAREADVAYARSLVNLPSLDTPDLTPAIFGEMVIERVRPMLYWLQVAGEYLPPGLDPRRRLGPQRARAAGTTVQFPRAGDHPNFLLRFSEIDAEIGGAGAAAGHYLARLEGLTSAPALYGRPTRLLAQRSEGARLVRESRISAVLDHVARPITDSVDVRLGGVPLPTVTLAPVGARLSLGNGAAEVALVRTGDSLAGRLLWRSTDVRWERLAGADAQQAAAPVGSRAWADALLWRTVSALNAVEIEARLSGALSSPRLGLRSNVGQEVAQSLRREVGAEIARVEQRIRAEVSRLVDARVQEAQQRATAVQAQVDSIVQLRRAELQRVRQQVDEEIRNLARRVPVRIPEEP